ncbi:MAG: hypothetical protein UR63_C0022G0004 [Candidatus Roizmanbacteria bacterium GW2011_GWC2_35_12]|uniref:Uncharacterized protein n=1 Tax=Candidatus Roizmanbacteria bacterium GW2011_GWC2_35_12 TaxID=1618485 RepID=A0A0G0DVL2_9BACT|nr:MAG: hypothetical protein UR63_C0022G0004 [Candidatus Roizmanbacteria bacterium GW2011_GWC2_35_12]
MRKINDLTSWEDFEKKLLKRKGYKELADKNEPKYQLVRSLIGARLKKRLSQKLENMESSPTISLLERISIALGSKLYISFQA